MRLSEDHLVTNAIRMILQRKGIAPRPQIVADENAVDRRF